MHRKRNPKQRLVTAVAAVGVVSVVHAQQQAPAQPDKNAPAAAVVPQVKVIGSAGTYDARRDDTAAKIVVGSDELVRYGDANVVEALKRIPGITVTSTGRGADIRMRGLGSGYTQILVNGERAPVGFSIDSVNPSQVERIEVIPSATAEFSTEAVAGTINVVLKKVVRTAQRQVQLGYGGDATERTPRATFLIADRDGKFSYSVSGNSRTTWFNRDVSITESGLSNTGEADLYQRTPSHEIGRLGVFNLIPRFNWTLENGDTLTSESILSYQRYHFTADRHTDVLLGAPLDRPDLNWGIRTRNATGKSDLTWNTRLDPDTGLEVKFGVQAASGDNDSERLRSGGTRPALRNAVDVDTTDKGFNTSGKLARKLGDAHSLTAGWEASRIWRDETNDERNGDGVPERTDFDAKVARTAAFVQDEWKVRPEWSIYLGARWERITTDIDAGRHVRTSSDIWSPIAQALVKLPGLPNDQVRVALTRTFKAPDLTNLVPRQRRYEINAPTNPDLEGNPDLRPEVARGIDVTYEHYFTKSALLSVGVSRRDIDDYTLTFVSLADNGRWVGRPVNMGKAEVKGLQVEAKLPLTLLNAQWPAVELRGSLSRNWSNVDEVPGPNNRVAEQVPLQATLAADYTSGPVTAGGSFVFRKGAWSTVTAAQSTYTTNRRDLDLYVLWKLNPKQQLRLTFANLLEADDIAASQYRTAGGSLLRTTEQAGHRSVRALWEVKF